MKAKIALLVMATLVSLVVQAQSANPGEAVKLNADFKAAVEKFQSDANPFIDKVNESCNFVEDFVESGDGGLTDKISGLTWYRCPVGQTWDGKICAGEKLVFTWYSAMIAAKSSNLLGKRDWRLPTIKELESITRNTTKCASAIQGVESASGKFHYSLNLMKLNIRDRKLNAAFDKKIAPISEDIRRTLMGNIAILQSPPISQLFGVNLSGDRHQLRYWSLTNDDEITDTSLGFRGGRAWEIWFTSYSSKESNPKEGDVYISQVSYPQVGTYSKQRSLSIYDNAPYDLSLSEKGLNFQHKLQHEHMSGALLVRADLGYAEFEKEFKRVDVARAEEKFLAQKGASEKKAKDLNDKQKEADLMASKRAYQQKAVSFQKNLKPGTKALNGLVLEVKDDLVKIQYEERPCTKTVNGHCKAWGDVTKVKWITRGEVLPRN